MHISDLSKKEIVKMALEALPGEEGDVIVLVDVRDGKVEVLSKSKDFENWAKNFNHKRVLLRLEEEDAKKDIGEIYERHKFEICCRIMEIKEMYPHLFE